MNATPDLNTPLWQLTVGEFLSLQNTIVAEPKTTVAQYDANKYVFGIDGIAKLLGCSATMVHEYRKDGWIEPAVSQRGKKIICNKQVALDLFNEYKNK